MRIFDVYAPGCHALDPPRVCSQQENVASQALHREILIQRSHRFAIRLGHDGVVRVLRNRSAACDRGKARAASSLYAPVHLIAMQQRAAPPA